jgi:serine/threonine protein kinase
MTDSSSKRGSELLMQPPDALHAGNGARDATPTPRPAPKLPADDQPTVISRPSPAGDSSASEAVSRILHGRFLPGERLGHFELLEFVGGGGMGKVFRARDTTLARSVALKILSPEHAADQETVLRFQNEAQSAARLDHENIARVYYVGEDRGLHYIAFEFIEGINVRDLVANRGPLPLAAAASYTLQVAEALTHASERNVVHRDIKPSNLLITPGGQAKLIDMGLARLREVDSPAELTASGVTLGTFDYISPEQARDPRNADVRSDIYSLGCTFFFMLTGRPPFVGGTMLQKLLQHQADEPPELRQFRPDLPEEVTRILRRMLAKEPNRRYATPAELVNELLVIARAAGLRPAAPGGRLWSVPAKRAAPYYYRHLPWLVSVIALPVIVFFLDRLWPYLPGPGPAIPATSGRAAGGEGTVNEGKARDAMLPSPSGRGSAFMLRSPDSARSIAGGKATGDGAKGEGGPVEGPMLQPPASSAAPPAAAPEPRSDLPPNVPLPATELTKPSASLPPPGHL